MIKNSILPTNILKPLYLSYLTDVFSKGGSVIYLHLNAPMWQLHMFIKKLGTELLKHNTEENSKLAVHYSATKEF